MPEFDIYEVLRGLEDTVGLLYMCECEARLGMFKNKAQSIERMIQAVECAIKLIREMQSEIFSPIKESSMGFCGGLAGIKPACNAGDLGSIPGLERSPEEGKGYPLQYSLKKTMNGGAWWAIIHGTAKSQI